MAEWMTWSGAEWFFYITQAVLILAVAVAFVMSLYGNYWHWIAGYEAKPGCRLAYMAKIGFFYQVKAAEKELNPKGLGRHRNGVKWKLRSFAMLPVVLLLVMVFAGAKTVLQKRKGVTLSKANATVLDISGLHQNTGYNQIRTTRL